MSIKQLIKDRFPFVKKLYVSLRKIVNVITSFSSEYICFTICAVGRKMHIPLFYSRFSNIESLKGTKNGKRCFIIAGGPSLTKEDIIKLRDEDTFAVNNLFRWFDQLEWIPSYYCCIDPINLDRFSEQYSIKYSELAKERCFFNSHSYKAVSKQTKSKKITYLPISALDHNYKKMSKRFKYSQDLLWGIYGMYTVVIAAITVAAYMGYKEVYLLGVDCNYMGSRLYAIDDKTRDKQLLNNHDAAFETQTNMINGYSFINNAIQKYGVKIYNATRGGKLEVFERVQLDDIL